MWIGWGSQIWTPQWATNSASRTWYDKALELQKELEKRRPNDPERKEELKRIKERLERPAPQE
jgi:hypothetical protein